MKVYLNEISDYDTELSFDQSNEWLAQAVMRVDEQFEEVATQARRNRPIEAHLTLRKVDDVYTVSGRIETQIELICSRCANTFHFHCKPRFSALFCKDPVLAGIAHLHRPTSDKSWDLKDAGKPVGQNQGHARHAHLFEDDAEGSGSKDLDITYLSNDFIDLGEVLTEQLQLQIPFQPLCKESCEGMCPTCGFDLNQGSCSCNKMDRQTPFSILKDMKL